MTLTGTQTFSPAIKSASNYMRWVADAFAPHAHGRMQEVGIEHGEYREYWREIGTYAGIDHDAVCIDSARSKYPADRYDVVDITDPLSVDSIRDEGLDSICFVNVFEHIEQDEVAIAALFDALKTGGHMIIWVPGMRVLYNALGRLAGHERRYTRASLRSVLPPGCVIKALHYVKPIGGFGWFAQKLRSIDSLADERVGSRIRFFDKHCVPLSRAMTPLTRSIFGQSVFGVIQKP